MKLVLYPDPILNRIARPLRRIDSGVVEKVEKMFQIMYQEKGVGLAAPQVGWSVRLFVVNPSGEPGDGEPRVYINPTILAQQGESICEEGCLSLPEIRGNVVRSHKITVRAQDLRGQHFEEEIEDLHARIVQHEHDHLDGILFIQRLSAADRVLIKSALKKLRESSVRAPTTR